MHIVCERHFNNLKRSNHSNQTQSKNVYSLLFGICLLWNNRKIHYTNNLCNWIQQTLYKHVHYIILYGYTCRIYRAIRVGAGAFREIYTLFAWSYILCEPFKIRITNGDEADTIQPQPHTPPTPHHPSPQRRLRPSLFMIAFTRWKVLTLCVMISVQPALQPLFQYSSNHNIRLKLSFRFE